MFTKVWYRNREKSLEEKHKTDDFILQDIKTILTRPGWSTPNQCFNQQRLAREGRRGPTPWRGGAKQSQLIITACFTRLSRFRKISLARERQKTEPNGRSGYWNKAERRRPSRSCGLALRTRPPENEPLCRRAIRLLPVERERSVRSSPITWVSTTKSGLGSGAVI